MEKSGALIGTFLVIGLLPGFLGFEAHAAAHPYHGSYAEMGWNAEGDAFQVSLRVIPEDLEEALSFRLKKTFVLDDRPETDRALLEYLFEFFTVTDQRHSRLPLNFLGKEVNHDGVWLYFEFSLGAAETLTIDNRILFDWEESQINRVCFTGRDGGRTVLVFRSGSPPQKLWSGTESKTP